MIAAPVRVLKRLTPSVAVDGNPPLVETVHPTWVSELIEGGVSKQGTSPARVCPTITENIMSTIDTIMFVTDLQYTFSTGLSLVSYES